MLDAVEEPPVAPSAEAAPLPASAFTRATTWGAVVAMACLFAWLAHAIGVQRPIGLIRDDGMYSLSARALLLGKGYVDLSLPDHPVALRYPPGFPALLALVLAGAKTIPQEIVRLHWVSPVVGAAWILSSFAYFRRRVGMRPWAACAAAALVAAQPYSLIMGTVVMSETTYSLVLLWVVWALELALAKATSPWAWLALGALSGGVCLIRTSGVALVLAVALVLLAYRRFTALGCYLGAFAVVEAFQAIPQASQGRNDYLSGMFGRIPHTPWLFMLVVATVLGSFFFTSLPGVLMAAVLGDVAHQAPWQIAIAALASLTILQGMARRLFDEASPERVLGVVLVACGSVLTMAYGLGFAFYAPDFFSRSTLPFTPFIVVFAFEGARYVLRELGPAMKQLVVAGLFAVSLFCTASQTYHMLQPGFLYSNLAPEIETMLAFVRDAVPDDAILYSPYGHMATFYTRRPSYEIGEVLTGQSYLPTFGSGRNLVKLVYEKKVNYLIGIPLVIVAGGRDEMVVQFTEFAKAAPGSLRVVYKNPDHTIEVFAVDRMALGLSYRRLMGQGRP